MLAIILGSFLSIHASAHQQADWTIFFSLLNYFERRHASGDLQELVLNARRLAGDAVLPGCVMNTKPATAVIEE